MRARGSRKYYLKQECLYNVNLGTRVYTQWKSLDTFYNSSCLCILSWWWLCGRGSLAFTIGDCLEFLFSSLSPIISKNCRTTFCFFNNNSRCLGPFAEEKNNVIYKLTQLTDHIHFLKSQTHAFPRLESSITNNPNANVIETKMKHCFQLYNKKKFMTM